MADTSDLVLDVKNLKTVFFTNSGLFKAVDDVSFTVIRGDRISMIFQEPMTSLNPVMRIGDQIAEAVRLHRNLSSREAKNIAVEMLRLVRIPEPERRAREY